MYWVYLITLTFSIFVPTIVRSGYKVFNSIQVQQFLIFVLGSICFILFLIMEKKLKKNISEKTKFQKQANRMNRDLKQSYFYIGEINRKLDILENIAAGFPETLQGETPRHRGSYDSIMGAIQVFGKSDEFSLSFIQKPKFDVIKEIKSFPELTINFSMDVFKENKHYNETEEYIIVTSPKEIDDVFSCIVIRKNQASNQIEDHEMMKTLAAQALFLFMYINQKKQSIAQQALD